MDPIYIDRIDYKEINMSWDIILFNSKEKILSIDKVEKEKLEATDFCSALLSSFKHVNKDDNHIEIKGPDFSIEFFQDEKPTSNKILSLYGEHGLFEIIELAKKFAWQIFATGLGDMVDLENPERNGYKNHRKYVEKIMKK